jgi:phosphate transport system substrate-binding protein
MIARLSQLCQRAGRKGGTSIRVFQEHKILNSLGCFLLAAIMVISASAFVGCATPGNGNTSPTTPANAVSPLISLCEKEASFTVTIDGSELMAPITTQIADEFMMQHPDVCVIVESNGTYTGFERLCRGKIHINEASLGPYPLQHELCDQNSIEWVELRVARAGFGIYVSSQNSFLECVTDKQIDKTWDVADMVHMWKELDPQWPDREIRRYAQFNDDCVPVFFDDPSYGEVQRLDYFDPGVVHALAADPFGIGIFSTTYYAQNKELLRQVGLFGDEACPFVTPLTAEPGHTPNWGQPFTIYANRRALGTHPAIAEFLIFYMKRVPDLLPEEGFYVLFPEDYQDNLHLIMNGE